MPGFIWFKDWAAASHNFTLCWLIFRTLVRLLAVTSKLSRGTNYCRRDQYCSLRPPPLHFHSLLSILPKLSLKPVLAPSYPPGELGSPPPHHFPAPLSLLFVGGAYGRLPGSSVYLLSTLNWGEEPGLSKWPTMSRTEECDVQYGGLEGREGQWHGLNWGMLSGTQHKQPISWRLSQIEVEYLGAFEMAAEDKGIVCWN